ncbi:MAG: tetratricopeptide repeat protein [Alphaproteobacteria bacterium]
MMHVTVQNPTLRRLQDCRGLAALAACLMLGACGQLPDLGSPEMMAVSQPAPQPEMSSQPASDLEKATDYWGQKFAKNPRDLKSALNYARNLKAMGQKRRAISVLQQAAIFHGHDRELAGDYGRLALEFGQLSVAKRLLAAADNPTKPDWKVISARGTVLAKEGKYGEAIPFFERALSLAHNHPSLVNNLALAHAMSGEAERAEGMLRQASIANPASPKIRQNLALVLSLQGRYDEAKQIASQDLAPEKAAKNTETLRRIVKLEPKAAPAPEPPKALAQWTTDVEVSAAKPVDTGLTAHEPNATADWTTSLKTSAATDGYSSKPSWTPQIAMSVAE